MILPVARSWRYIAWLAAISLLAGAVYYAAAGRLWRPFQAAFEREGISQWTKLGGVWRVEGDILRNLSAGRGDKLVVGSERWSDYELSADIRLDSDTRGTRWGDAGLLFRITQPMLGVDDYDGYYLGIEPDENGLILGRVTFAWERVRIERFDEPVRIGDWYQIRLNAKGCHFDAEARRIGGGRPVRLSYFDERCNKRSGSVGVRVYSLRASWRGFAVKPL